MSDENLKQRTWKPIWRVRRRVKTKVSDENLKQRMEKLVDAVCYGLHERREHAAVMLLAALSGQNTFLLGPPGTAKSLLARRLASVFASDENRGNSYFEYLMQRFSTPEDLFGPVSIEGLKRDEYTRKTEGFLPTAHFAFLDEIWKSSPAILNTLLTIINEKKFRNGAQMKDVPLKTLVAASNETPPEGQGLDALYDRLGVRLYVPSIKEEDEFENFLRKEQVGDKVSEGTIKISSDEWDEWRSKLHKVELSPETMQVIRAIRRDLAKKNKPRKDKVYVSDRRWKKAVLLLQAGAFFCGRLQTNLVDALLLRHCLWTKEENRENVIKIVEDAVREFGFVTERSSADIVKEKEQLDNEIQRELYVAEKVYDTDTKEIPMVGKCFHVQVTKRDDYHKEIYHCLVPMNQMQSNTKFYPVDKSGEQMTEFICKFENKGRFSIEHSYYEIKRPGDKEWRSEIVTSPKVVGNKYTTRKNGVNPRLIQDLRKSGQGIANKFDGIIKDIEKQKQKLEAELDTPFIAKPVRKIAVQGIDDQLAEVRKQHLDCEVIIKKIDGESE